MSNKFSDYAANERTFLAWIRTSISILLVAFFIEKFDLAIRNTIGYEKKYFIEAEIISFVFSLTSIAMFMYAMYSFTQNKKDIAKSNNEIYISSKSNYLLFAVLITLMIALIAYFYNVFNYGNLDMPSK